MICARYVSLRRVCFLFSNFSGFRVVLRWSGWRANERRCQLSLCEMHHHARPIRMDDSGHLCPTWKKRSETVLIHLFALFFTLLPLFPALYISRRSDESSSLMTRKGEKSDSVAARDELGRVLWLSKNTLFQAWIIVFVSRTIGA